MEQDNFKLYTGNAHYAGVLKVYIAENPDLSAFKDKCAKFIMENAKRTDNLVYAGMSNDLTRRIENNHKYGNIHNSTLRDTISHAINFNKVNIPIETYITQWIEENLIFYITGPDDYPPKDPDAPRTPEITKNILISEFNPVFNDGRNKFKNL